MEMRTSKLHRRHVFYARKIDLSIRTVYLRGIQEYGEKASSVGVEEEQDGEEEQEKIYWL